LRIVGQETHDKAGHEAGATTTSTASRQRRWGMRKKRRMGAGRGKVATASEATEGEKVKLPRLPITDAPAVHATRGYVHSESVGRGKCGGDPRPPKARLAFRHPGEHEPQPGFRQTSIAFQEMPLVAHLYRLFPDLSVHPCAPFRPLLQLPPHLQPQVESGVVVLPSSRKQVAPFMSVRSVRTWAASSSSSTSSRG